MARVGIVISVQGSYAEVSTSRRGPCDGCSEHASCAVPMGPSEGGTELVTAVIRAGAKPGDTVELDLGGRMELKLSLLVWVVPICGLIGGAVAGTSLHDVVGMGEDPAALVGAIIGIASAYLLLRRVDRKALGREELIPRITRVTKRVTKAVKTVRPSACPGKGPAPGGCSRPHGHDGSTDHESLPTSL